MNILVTGATGFIGGAVVKKLLSKAYSVKILVRDRRKINFPKKVIVYEGDLRDFKSINKAISGTDIVINCAAALPHHKLDGKDYRDINVLGVKNIIKASELNNVKKIIHVSTVGIYGPTLDKNISERSKTNPIDIYTKSKLDAEKIINKSKFKNKSIIIRPTIAYGPGDVRPVFLRLFKMIKTGINISIGGGGNYIHTVYIDNLVDVILKSIRLKSALGKDFIVGDLVCPTMNEIVKEIIHIQHKKCVNFVIPTEAAMIAGKILGVERTVRFVSENRKYNVYKVKNYFNLKKDVGISEGIKHTFDWYKKNNLI